MHTTWCTEEKLLLPVSFLTVVAPTPFSRDYCGKNQEAGKRHKQHFVGTVTLVRGYVKNFFYKIHRSLS
jgi:hypothetical protein